MFDLLLGGGVGEDVRDLHSLAGLAGPGWLPCTHPLGLVSVLELGQKDINQSS